MANEQSTTMKSTGSEQKQGDASGQNHSSLSQQANQTKEALKSTVAETTANVKDQTRQVANDARQAIGDIATEATATVKQTANEALGEARTRAESVVDERKGQAADRLHGIAGALRETSNTLHSQEEETFANYAAAAADQVEKFSGYLRNQNIGTLLQDIEGFARRQPELFLAGTLAAGFMLGRFFKSSGNQPSQGNQGYGSSQYNQQYNQPYDQRYNQYGAPGYQDASRRSHDANSYRDQYGSPEYQRQSGASGSQYQGPSGSSANQGQYGSSGYPGQQAARQGQTNWANSGGTPSQMPNVTGERAGNGRQSADVSQHKSDQTRTDQQKAAQSHSSSARSSNTGNKEE